MKSLVYILLFTTLVSSGQMSDKVSNSLGKSGDTSALRRIKWLNPAIAVAYAGTTYLTYRYLDVMLQDESQEGKDAYETAIAKAVNPFGVGKYKVIAWGTTAMVSVLINDRTLQKTAIIWLGSLGVNSMLTDQLKLTFQRHRPLTGSPYNTFDWRNGPKINRSFPSAHTSNVFTTATVWATIYKGKKWVPPVAYGIATLTGLSRIYNNAHWASDVLMGAAVGFLSAKAMIKLFNRLERRLFVVPGINSRYASVCVLCMGYDIQEGWVIIPLNIEASFENWLL